MSRNLRRHSPPFTLLASCIAALLMLGWGTGPSQAFSQTFAPDHLRVRSDFRRCAQAFRSGKARVAFLGGSITEMNGYRPKMMDYLQKQHPNCEFDFINAGIASTCSTTGAHRLKSDVFQRGTIDLLFVEFAVNDDQDAAHSPQQCVRGMEGILRQTRKLQPDADIVMVYFVNPSMLKQLQGEMNKPVGRRKLPLAMAAHERVARHYDVTSVLLASEVALRIDQQKLRWEQYGGTHPKGPGNRLAADMCIACLETGWQGKAGPDERKLPAALDPFSYDGGDWLSPTKSHATGSWKIAVPDWKSLPGQFRARFRGIPALVGVAGGGKASEPAAVPFTGRGIGAFILAGPDAGQLLVSIDGGEWKTVELFHRFSKGLHYPRTIMFFEELKPGPHRLAIKVAGSTHSESRGYAARILKFAVNH